MSTQEWKCSVCDVTYVVHPNELIKCVRGLAIQTCGLTRTDADPVAVRGATHGDFAKSSLVIQLLRSTWRAAPMWEQMTPAQKTAFDEIALKQVRILYGDPKFKDHWDDVVGYGKLGGRDCV